MAMPLTTLVYVAVFILSVFGSFAVHPAIGVYAYIMSYNVNPLGLWWGYSLPSFMYNYSFILGITVIGSTVIQMRRLKFKELISGHELIFLAFVVIIWLTALISPFAPDWHFIYKMAKVFLICILATHIITTRKLYEGLIWVLLLSTLYTAVETNFGQIEIFDGRVQTGVGGPDFNEGNFLAAHYAMLLPIFGAMLLHYGWKTRGLVIITAVLATNAIVMIRSRGCLIALGVGALAALFLSGQLREHRPKLIGLLVVALLGGFFLVDENFIDRMTTITVEEEAMDTSTSGRLDAWRGAVEMAMDYPMGVGAGNYGPQIGNYRPELAGKDTHSTYFRCLAELGFHGLFVLLALIFNAFRILRDIQREARLMPPQVGNFYLIQTACLRVSLITYLTAVTFISSTYIEAFYWLLMFPLFLQRSLENEPRAVHLAEIDEDDTELEPGLGPVIPGRMAPGVSPSSLP
jgi:probable O-glycosylation ligase (exosortase A-associated)